MSGYLTRSSQESNDYLPTVQLGPPQYLDSDTSSFVYHDTGQYGFSQRSYTSFPSQCATTSSLQTPYATRTLHMPSQTHMVPQPFGNTAPPQQMLVPRQSLSLHPPGWAQGPFLVSNKRHAQGHGGLRELDIESQDSIYEATMLSEPILPPLEGLPRVHEFDQLMKSYVDCLSSKKRDKALIHASRARNIKSVLLNPKDTSVESAQFRFWVKKMFRLQPNDRHIPDRQKQICHDGKPVAIREKLFKVLTRAHLQCQHGGRDKTSVQVRRTYSWVPKELISRFVKLCPTCQNRRTNTRFTAADSDKGSPSSSSSSSFPEMWSPPDYGQDSTSSCTALCDPSRSGPNSEHSSLYQASNPWPSTPHRAVTNQEFQTSPEYSLSSATMSSQVAHSSRAMLNAVSSMATIQSMTSPVTVNHHASVISSNTDEVCPGLPATAFSRSLLLNTFGDTYSGDAEYHY